MDYEPQSVQVTLTDQNHQFGPIRVDGPSLFSFIFTHCFTFQQIFLHSPNFSSVTRKQSSNFLPRVTQFIEHKNRLENVIFHFSSC